jgi:hypothetical protein
MRRSGRIVIAAILAVPIIAIGIEVEKPDSTTITHDGEVTGRPTADALIT